MSKVNLKPAPMVYPLPAVLVSCGGNEKDYNLITIAWTGTICSDPPMCYISVRHERHSYALIKKYGDFVINLTTEKLLHATDYCGIHSGKDVKKFDLTGLTPVKADLVNAPLVKESPVNIECKVKEIKVLGSHDMFIADIVAIHTDETSECNGRISYVAASPVCCIQGKYYSIGSLLGPYGFTGR
jgi:flavin reductase (DIM6/NTAB) family NADH-FMN oxidoreductase RutF